MEEELEATRKTKTYLFQLINLPIPYHLYFTLCHQENDDASMHWLLRSTYPRNTCSAFNYPLSQSHPSCLYGMSFRTLPSLIKVRIQKMKKHLTTISNKPHARCAFHITPFRMKMMMLYWNVKFGISAARNH
jgi:hypothetical protein